MIDIVGTLPHDGLLETGVVLGLLLPPHLLLHNLSSLWEQTSSTLYGVDSQDQCKYVLPRSPQDHETLSCAIGSDRAVSKWSSLPSRSPQGSNCTTLEPYPHDVAVCPTSSLYGSPNLLLQSCFASLFLYFPNTNIRTTQNRVYRMDSPRLSYSLGE